MEENNYFVIPCNGRLFIPFLWGISMVVIVSTVLVVELNENQKGLLLVLSLIMTFFFGVGYLAEKQNRDRKRVDS